MSWSLHDQVSSGGGDEGIRTPGLLNAIEALSQLSYIPTIANLPTLERANGRQPSAAIPLIGASPRRLPGEFGLVGAPSGHRRRAPTDLLPDSLWGMTYYSCSLPFV
jgi:hypothetical protein